MTKLEQSNIIQPDSSQEQWSAAEAVEKFMEEEEKRKNKELRRQVVNTLVSVPASVIGVKGVYDVPVYIQQKIKAGMDKEELKDIFANLKKIGVDKKNIEDKKVGEIIDLAQIDKMEEKIEKMNVSEEVKNKLMQELNALVENYHHEIDTLGEKKNEKLTETLDEYVKTKISGIQAAREGVNTLLTASGAYVLRGFSAGIFDTLNRGISLEKEREKKNKEYRSMADSVAKELDGLYEEFSREVNEGGEYQDILDEIKKREGDMNDFKNNVEDRKWHERASFWKDLVVGGIQETWREMRLKESKEGEQSTKFQKNMKFVKAWGNVARWTGMGAMMKWHPDTAGSAVEKLIDAMRGKVGFSEIGDNYAANIERLEKFYSGLFTKSFNWVSSGLKDLKLPEVDTAENSSMSANSHIVENEQMAPNSGGEILVTEKANASFESLLDQGKIRNEDREAFIKMFTYSSPDDLAQNIKNFINTPEQVRDYGDRIVGGIKTGAIIPDQAQRSSGSWSMNENIAHGQAQKPSDSWSMNENVAHESGQRSSGSWSMNENAVREMAEKVNEELKNSFDLKLGKGKVPGSLERVLHMMSVDTMKNVLGQEKILGEEEGVKSLNIAANLVRLAEGKNSAGIKAENLNDVLHWDPKSRTLEIKDHDRFNVLVRDLHAHADQLWEKGVLKEGAGKYFDDIKKDTWNDIVRGEGLRESMQGTENTDIRSGEKEEVSGGLKTEEQKEIEYIKKGLLEKHKIINDRVAEAENVINGRDKVISSVAGEKLSQQLGVIYGSQPSDWDKFIDSSAKDFVAGKFSDRGKIISHEELGLHKDLQAYVKSAHDKIGPPADNESVDDYLHRFESEKLKSSVHIDDNKRIDWLRERTGLDIHSDNFQKAFATMHESIKTDKLRSVGYMNTFAASEGRVGYGIRDLLGLEHGLRQGSEWTKDSNGIITVHNVYGQKGFELVLTDDKIGIRGPGNMKWGVGEGKLGGEPKNDLNLDNLKKAKELILNKFAGFVSEEQVKPARKVEIPLTDAQEHSREQFVDMEKRKGGEQFMDMEKQYPGK